MFFPFVSWEHDYTNLFAKKIISTFNTQIHPRIITRLKGIDDSSVICHPHVVAYLYFLKDRANTQYFLTSEEANFEGVLALVMESKERANKSVKDYILPLDFKPNLENHIPTFDRNMVMATEMSNNIDPFKTKNYLSDAERLAPVVSAAAKILYSTVPEYIVDMLRVSQAVTFFTRRLTSGFADPRSHGMMFINSDYVSSPPYMAEQLLHESSHVLFHMLLNLFPMAKDSNSQLFNSGLRKDKRPLFGILHQVFVLSRLIRFFEITNIKPGVLGDNIDFYKSALSKNLDILENKASLTAAGEKFVQDVNAVYEF